MVILLAAIFLALRHRRSRRSRLQAETFSNKVQNETARAVHEAQVESHAGTFGAPQETGSIEVHFASFDERPLGDVERSFETLLARGILRGEPSSAEALMTAQIPAYTGPVFRALARRFRSVSLPEVEVTIVLHQGQITDDAIGGWRLAAEPEEMDIRLALPNGLASNADGDVILDATWSPRASAEVARHSTILHFLVRAAVGDRI